MLVVWLLLLGGREPAIALGSVLGVHLGLIRVQTEVLTE